MYRFTDWVEGETTASALPLAGGRLNGRERECVGGCRGGVKLKLMAFLVNTHSSEKSGKPAGC